MEIKKIKNKLKYFRISFLILFAISITTTAIGFIVLKLLNNDACYTVLGMGGSITTFILIFVLVSFACTFSSFRIGEANRVDVYATFITRLIFVNNKLYSEHKKGFFEKSKPATFLLGKKKVEVLISQSNEVSVRVDGQFIPKIKEVKTIGK